MMDETTEEPTTLETPAEEPGAPVETPAPETTEDMPAEEGTVPAAPENETPAP